MRLDQSVDAAPEGLADHIRVEEATGGHGAVAQHDEVLGGGLGLGLGDARHQGVDRGEEPLAVRKDRLVHGMAGVGVFGHGVEEGAATEAG